MRALLAAAVVIALALSPSVSECLQAHEAGHPASRWLWLWVALVVVLALAFGEQLFGAG